MQNEIDIQTTYESPSIRRIGSVRDLTEGNQDGLVLDQDYPVETPKPELTFS